MIVVIVIQTALVAAIVHTAYRAVQSPTAGHVALPLALAVALFAYNRFVFFPALARLVPREEPS